MELLDVCKLASFKVAEYYALSDNPDYIHYAERILNCSPELNFVMLPPEQRRPSRQEGLFPIDLEYVNWCRTRHCTMCQYARVSKWRAKFFQSLPKLRAEYPQHQFLFLTLTVRNCKAASLKSTIQQMYEGWRRMTGRVSWMADGYIKALEITMPWDVYYADEFIARMGEKSLQSWIIEQKQVGAYKDELLRK